MSASPILDFVRLSGAGVVATYANMPPGAAIVFINKTSGAPFGPPFAIGSGGESTTPLPSGLPSGDYYLQAQDSTGADLARSVEFYIDSGGGTSS
jgi:hypothetical protein